MKPSDLFESIAWVSRDKDILGKRVKPSNIVTRLFVPPVACGPMHVSAVVAKPNPMVSANHWQVGEWKDGSSSSVVAIAEITGHHAIVRKLKLEITNLQLFELLRAYAPVRAFELLPFGIGRYMQNPL